MTRRASESDVGRQRLHSEVGGDDTQTAFVGKSSKDLRQRALLRRERCGRSAYGLGDLSVRVLHPGLGRKLSQVSCMIRPYVWPVTLAQEAGRAREKAQEMEQM